MKTVRVVVFAVWDSLGLEPKDDGWEMSEVQQWVAVAIAMMKEAMWEWSNTKRDKTTKEKVRAMALIPC